MTRAPSSSPSWFPVHDDRPEPDPVHTWRRLGGEEALVRAKTIPRCEIPIPNHSSFGNTGNIRNVVAITRHPECAATPAQSPSPVQLPVRKFTEFELDVLEVIEEHGGVASALLIAEELDTDVHTLRRREIHRLHRDGVIEPVHARGYRRVK